MGATLVKKRVDLDKFYIVKYQLIHHCFINKIRLNDTELNCLALLGELGKIRLTEFCKIAENRGILSNSIGVNNCLGKIEDKKLHVKEGLGKKMLFLNPVLNIQSEGNIVLNLIIVKLEAETTTGSVQNNGE